MNCGEDESPGVTLETIGTVTMCQDEEGNLVLSCNDELQVREGSEPSTKRICLVAEPNPAIGTSPAATGDTGNFVVAAPPRSDVGASSAAHSPTGNASVGSLSDIDGLRIEPTGADPVSQTWFTTKEDKDSLYIKGHKWKQGMWSKEETDLLIINIESYLKANSIGNAAEVIFEMPKDERKDFYRTIARGLNRPLFAVYRRVLRMYDNRNHVGKYTTEEIEQLKELRAKHRNDWAAIGSALGRSASSVKDRCRLMKDTCNTGKWTVEEEQRLADVVHELTGTTPGEAVTQGVCWADVAERVGTRSEKQCRSKWLNYLNWKQSGGREWTKDDDIELILRIVELKPREESEINWEKLCNGWNSVRSPQWLRSKWWTVKRQVTTHKEVPFLDLLDYLSQTHIPVLRQVVQRVHPTGGPGAPAALTGAPGVPAPLATAPICLRLPRGEGSAMLPQTTIATLQIPVQITQTGDSGDGETVTINAAALQTFEILPSFHLQATGALCTFLLQAGSAPGLPVTLSGGGPAVTLVPTGGPPAPVVSPSPSSTAAGIPEGQVVMHAVQLRDGDRQLQLQDGRSSAVEMPHGSRVIIHAMSPDSVHADVRTIYPTAPGDTDLVSHPLASPPTGIIAAVTDEVDVISPRHLSSPDNRELPLLVEEALDTGSDDGEKEAVETAMEAVGAGRVAGLHDDEDERATLIADAAEFVSQELSCPDGDPVHDGSMETAMMAVIAGGSPPFPPAGDDLDDVSVLPLTTLHGDHHVAPTPPRDPILQTQSDASNITGSALNSPEHGSEREAEEE
uniref:Cyclin-D-binding Myb-like transcription factor 1 n=1 Tax=Petromyzon marinus TaxID=7757 RepID=A0AAJ7TR80_PETMA|nr:cyclin-D-binding Myb-like transcription factor 1 isoform X1 [Petromyzon marinus]XP_032822657.1 cyclin-D-binding Myb-like transcription factor 1 isoform X1 [Petromyzon marinus]XP_032822658.1 cyclin-D-binding Myb-like transcription factor 1 isoform X1 [Petromyzon marinus]